MCVCVCVYAEATMWDYAPEGYKEGCYIQDLRQEAAKWLEPSSVTIGPR